MIKSNGNQVFSVPWTPEGKLFIKFFRLYANTKRFKVRLRYRGGKRRYGSPDTMPENAKWVAVYFEEKENQYLKGWQTGNKAGQQTVMNRLKMFIDPGGEL